MALNSFPSPRGFTKTFPFYAQDWRPFEAFGGARFLKLRVEQAVMPRNSNRAEPCPLLKRNVLPRDVTND
jgi:hypothetical protein